MLQTVKEFSKEQNPICAMAPLIVPDKYPDQLQGNDANPRNHNRIMDQSIHLVTRYPPKNWFQHRLSISTA